MTRRSVRHIYELQQRAKNLLEQGMTQAQVASILGVSTRTIRRWLENPRTLDEVVAENRVAIADYVPPSQDSEVAPLEPANLENLSFEEQVDRLLQLSLEGLNRILTNPDLSPRDFLAACRTIREFKRDSLTVWANPSMAISANEGETDFQLALRALRESLLNPSAHPKVIAAATGMLKMIEAQNNLPRSVVVGRDEMQAELQDIKSMTPDEIMQEYRSIIAGNYR